MVLYLLKFIEWYYRVVYGTMPQEIYKLKNVLGSFLFIDRWEIHRTYNFRIVLIHFVNIVIMENPFFDKRENRYLAVYCRKNLKLSN